MLPIIFQSYTVLTFCDIISIIRTLTDAIEDPTGRGRKGVVLQVDSTYVPIDVSSDPQLQKMLYFPHAGGHCVKVMAFSTLHPKVISFVYNNDIKKYVVRMGFIFYL